MVLFINGAAFAQQKLLYIGNNDQPPCDNVITTGMEGKDYVVTWNTVDEYTANFPDAAAYSEYDVVMFSESMGSRDGKPFKDVGFPIPCVSLEGWSVKMERWDMIPADMEATHFLQGGDAVTDLGVNTLIINDVDHWIANQYEANYELVWNTDPETDGVTGFNLDGYVTGAIALGRYNLPEFADLPTIWAIPEGSVIESDATVVASNLVMIGTIADGMAAASDEFIDFLDICIKWVTGNTVNVNNIQSNYLSVYPNPTKGIVNVSLTLTVSGNTRVNVNDIPGK